MWTTWLQITHCTLYTLQHDCNFGRGEVDEPGATAHVQKEAAEAERRGVSLSLLLSDKKVSLGSFVQADSLVDYKKNKLKYKYLLS